MPNPLSADIRARFEVLFSQGLTGREIGRRLMISAASASRLSQKLKQGLGLTPADNPRNTGYGICNCSISGDLGILGWWSSAWHGPEVPWAPAHSRRKRCDGNTIHVRPCGSINAKDL